MWLNNVVEVFVSVTNKLIVLWLVHKNWTCIKIKKTLYCDKYIKIVAYGVLMLCSGNWQSDEENHIITRKKNENIGTQRTKKPTILEIETDMVRHWHIAVHTDTVIIKNKGNV